MPFNLTQVNHKRLIYMAVDLLLNRTQLNIVLCLVHDHALLLRVEVQVIIKLVNRLCVNLIP